MAMALGLGHHNRDIVLFDTAVNYAAGFRFVSTWLILFKSTKRTLARQPNL